MIPGDTRRQVEAAGNQTMDILSDWANNAKMVISSQKSRLIILKGNMNARPLVIKNRGTRIRKVDSASYVGVEIDTGLTYSPHVKRQGTKAKTLFGKVGRLMKVSYGASTISLNFLYKTVILPICIPGLGA